MPKRVVIKGEGGEELGAFSAPDDASEEEVAEYYRKFKAKLLAKREAENESKRRTTLPPTRNMKCSICEAIVEAVKEFPRHMEMHNKELGLGEKLSRE